MNASHRLAMRLLMVGFDGLELPGHVGRWIDDGLGGVILFRRNIESLEQRSIAGRSLQQRSIETFGGRIKRSQPQQKNRPTF